MKKLILQAIVCVLIGAIVTGGFTYFAERMEEIGEENGKKDTAPLGYNMSEAAIFAGGAVIIFMGFPSLGTHFTRSTVDKSNSSFMKNGGNMADIAVVYKNNPKGVLEHVKSPERVLTQKRKGMRIIEALLPFVIGILFITAGAIGLMNY